MRQCNFFLRIRYMVKKLKHRLYIRKLLVLFVKLAKNVDPDKYGYSGYGIAFDLCSLFSWSYVTCGKRFIIFGTNMSSSVYDNNKKKDISEGPAQCLDNTTMTAEAM